MSKNLTHTSEYTKDFAEIVAIIERSRQVVYRTVNAELIALYWQVGEYISKKCENAHWGKSVVDQFAAFMRQHHSTLKGFSSFNVWRMKRFYETYSKNTKLSPVVTVLWSNNLLILSGDKG